MGNSLNLHKDDSATYGKLTLTTDKQKGGTLLNDFITDTFKNSYDTYWDDNKLRFHKSAQQKARDVSRYPYIARACCTRNQYIPVELPYYEDGKIKSAFPKIKILNTDYSQTDNENVNDPECSRTVPAEENCQGNPHFCGDFVRNLNIPNNKLNRSEPFMSQNKNASQCTTFYSPDGVGNFKDDNSTGEPGFCDRVIDIRKKEFPDSKYIQLYGDLESKEFQGDTINGQYNSAYPDCNCLNSSAFHVKQKSAPDPGSQNELAQNKDPWCKDKTTKNKYVRFITTKPIAYCINIVDTGNISASFGGTVNIESTCQIGSKSTPGITTKPPTAAPTKKPGINIDTDPSTGTLTTPPAPTTQAPATQAPATQAPSTQAPSTQAPSTQAPSTQAPSTQAPSTESADEKRKKQMEILEITGGSIVVGLVIAMVLL